MRSKIILALLSLLMVRAQAATWYVATTGNNSNPGTLADPLLTLDEAILQASPGDVIELRGGSYVSNEVRITKSDLTIRSYPGEWAVLTAVTNVENTASCIWYSEPDVVGGTLENLEIIGGYYYGVSFETNWDWGVAPQDRHGVRNIILRNLKIHDTGRDCIKIKPGCDGIQILGCELYNSGVGPGNQTDPNAEGIDNVNGDGMVVRNCHIHHTSTTGVYAKGGTDGCIIDENLIRETGEAGILLGFYTDAEYFDEVANPAYFECRNSVARNNIIVHTGGAGIGFFAAQNCRAEHNTVITASPTFHSPLYCSPGEIWINSSLTLTPANENIAVINNIFIDESGTGPDDYTVQVRSGGLSGANIVDHNIYHKTTGAASFDDDIAWPAMTFTQWQTALSLDAQSMEASPALDGDFHLLAGSPAIDAAMASSATHDYDYNLRAGTADIGADEFGAGASLVTPPQAGVIGTGSPNTLQAAADAQARATFQAWPNPAHDRLQVRSASERIHWITLTDLYGRCVVQTAEPKFSVAGLPAGSYCLKVVTTSGMQVTQIQIVH
jgi:hypothetical protein